MTSVIAIASGRLRSGSCVSSTMLVRSSKPMNAKNASRLAKPTPIQAPASGGGSVSSALPMGVPACAAAAMIAIRPASSMSVDAVLASRTDSRTPHAQTRPTAITIADTTTGCGRSTKVAMYPADPSVTVADAMTAVPIIAMPVAVDNRREPNAPLT